MKLRGLSDDLWPIRIRPFADELLTSWLVRLAHAHGYRVETASVLVFGRGHDFWSRDSDRSIPACRIEKLAQVSGIDASSIEALTLRSWEGYLCEVVRSTTVSPGILPTGVYHRKRKRHGLMFCPACLQADEHPYYRKIWRLTFLTTCPVHGTAMLDECWSCGAPIVPHRVDMKWSMRTSNGASLQALCFHCGADLRSTEYAPSDADEVHFSKQVAISLEKGVAELSPQSTIHSIAFFNGVRVIAGCVRLASVRGAQTGHQARLIAGNFKWGGLEFLRLEQRRKFFNGTTALLSAWPSKFLDFAKTHHITFTDLTPVNAELPYWIWVVARWHLFRAQGRITRGLDRVEITRVGQRIFEKFLDAYDRDIVMASSLRKKNSLCADKIMFIVARTHHLTQPQLAALTLTDAIAMVEKAADASLAKLPSTEDEGAGWLKWYLVNLRPNMIGGEAEISAFLSHDRGKQLQANAIGARFRKRVKQTENREQGLSYQAFVMRFDP